MRASDGCARRAVSRVVAGACSRPVLPPVVVASPLVADYVVRRSAAARVDALRQPQVRSRRRAQDPGRPICFGSMTPRGAGSRPAISRAPRPDFRRCSSARRSSIRARRRWGISISRERISSRPLQRFDRVLQSNAGYVPALVGRGEALLALSREPEALAAFESAVKLDPQLADDRATRRGAARPRAAGERRGGPQGRAGEPARRGGDAVRAGDRRVARQRVPGARSCRDRGEAGENGSGAGALPARRRNGSDRRRIAGCASARCSTRAAISKAP